MANLKIKQSLEKEWWLISTSLWKLIYPTVELYLIKQRACLHAVPEPVFWWRPEHNGLTVTACAILPSFAASFKWKHKSFTTKTYGTFLVLWGQHLGLCAGGVPLYGLSSISSHYWTFCHNSPCVALLLLKSPHNTTEAFVFCCLVHSATRHVLAKTYSVSVLHEETLPTSRKRLLPAPCTCWARSEVCGLRCCRSMGPVASWLQPLVKNTSKGYCRARPGTVTQMRQNTSWYPLESLTQTRCHFLQIDSKVIIAGLTTPYNSRSFPQ